MNGEHKITSGHRARTALVYLRQSTLMQVREHTESTLRQYALADTAVALGWAARDVEVIDRDLGLSGTSAAHRQGFRELMSRVCLGEVGAVLGLEISRLGRSNADLARLAEMARLTGTLLIDSDGVYDLADFNDWLVLGLKSTMSQAELHIMAGRLQAAKRAAAERGELRAPLPVGLVYDADGATVTDPDAEVQAAVADIFACFLAAGSAYGVVAAFAGRKFPQRAYGGAWAGQLRWSPLTHHRVLQVLKNPAYAGAYVYGRCVTRKKIDADGNVRTVTADLPRAQWPVLIKDHHPGYITWEEYLAIEARLAANHTGGGGGPVREGTALCQGIILCGGCGGPMAANYHGDDRASYECHSHRDGKKTPGCRSITAHAVDDAVAGALLATLTPSRSRSRSPPPARSPASTSGRAARPSSPSNAPGMRQTAPSGPSARSSQRTGWSPAPWKPGGKPSSPRSPTPSRPWQPPRTPCRRCLTGPAWPNSPPTCPRYGTPPPPPSATASACCAP